MLVILYLVLGYWAFGVVNSGKVYFGTSQGIFLNRIIWGAILGWILIPIAIFKMISGRRN